MDTGGHFVLECFLWFVGGGEGSRDGVGDIDSDGVSRSLGGSGLLLE